jgi:hypothetical protein
MERRLKMLPNFPDDFFGECSTGDAETIMESRRRTVFEMRCDNCKYWVLNTFYYEAVTCTNEELINWGSDGEYPFKSPADFYCKFWEKIDG